MIEYNSDNVIIYKIIHTNTFFTSPYTTPHSTPLSPLFPTKPNTKHKNSVKHPLHATPWKARKIYHPTKKETGLWMHIGK